MGSIGAFGQRASCTVHGSVHGADWVGGGRGLYKALIFATKLESVPASPKFAYKRLKNVHTKAF